MNHNHNRVGSGKACEDFNTIAGKDFKHKLNKYNVIK